MHQTATRTGNKPNVGKDKDVADRYWAVEAKNLDTCKALGWAWVSVCPYVLATGDNADWVRDAGWSEDEHAEGIHVHAAW